MRRQLIIGSLILGTLIILGTLYARASLQYRSQEVASNSGAIRGRVLDAEGKPVSQARVSAGLISGLLRSALTDDLGNFFIEGLKPGTYHISASKEGADYPDTLSSFHCGSAGIFLQVTVYAGQVTSEIVIRLCPKAAKLIGRIVDATTNQPVESAQIFLSRVDNPKYSYLTGPNQPKMKGGFKILVPTVPFTIKVSAPGYQDWYYGSDGSQKHMRAMKLIPKMTENLVIALRPKPN